MELYLDKNETITEKPEIEQPNVEDIDDYLVSNFIQIPLFLKYFIKSLHILNMSINIHTFFIEIHLPIDFHSLLHLYG